MIQSYRNYQVKSAVGVNSNASNSRKPTAGWDHRFLFVMATVWHTLRNEHGAQAEAPVATVSLKQRQQQYWWQGWHTAPLPLTRNQCKSLGMQRGNTSKSVVW